MKTKNVKKKENNRPLRWIVGLGLAAFCLVSVIVAVLVFNSGLFQMPSGTTPLATLTEVTIIPEAPTVSPMLAGTASPDLPLALATARETVLEFDPSAANQILPEDVLEEVIYYGRGAGTCEGQQDSSPRVSREPMDGELMLESSLLACGWEKDEVLIGTIQYPDGQESTQLIPVQAQGNIYYGILSFTPTLDDPVGPYTFILQGQRGVVTSIAEFHEPDGPRLYAIDASHILFYRFAPQESVRLLCYDREGKFVAWQEIKVDQNGNQSVVVKADDCTFAALGESFEEVHIVENGEFAAMSNVRRTCGGLFTRLWDELRAGVAHTDGSNQPVRAEPGYSQEILTTIPGGTVVEIFGSQECADGSLWWYIRTTDGVWGWMAEEQNGVYLLELVP